MMVIIIEKVDKHSDNSEKKKKKKKKRGKQYIQSIKQNLLKKYHANVARNLLKT